MANAYLSGVDVTHGAPACYHSPRHAATENVMATPGFPLPLRNALADLVCSALEGDDSLAALAWLAAPDEQPSAAAARRLAAVHLVDPGGSSLLAVHAPWDAAVRAHAERGLRAATAHRARDGRHADPVGRAIVQAGALWEQELFFEVHEVLEAVWQREGGARRQALQGLIQVAVAFHHLAHGNPRGARTLMREGRARLAGSPAGTLPWADVEQLVAATAAWEAALARDTGGAVPAGPPPRLVIRPEEPASGALD